MIANIAKECGTLDVIGTDYCVSCPREFESPLINYLLKNHIAFTVAFEARCAIVKIPFGRMFDELNYYKSLASTTFVATFNTRDEEYALFHFNSLKRIMETIPAEYKKRVLEEIGPDWKEQIEKHIALKYGPL